MNGKVSSGKVVLSFTQFEDTKDIKAKSELDPIDKERMELALVGSKTSVLDWNFSTNDFYISPSWKEMLGYGDDELANTTYTWQSRVHPDDRKNIVDQLKITKDKKLKYFKNTHRLKHKDGHWVWVLGRAQIMYDEEGRKVRMVGTHTDITEEKELQLKYSQQAQMIQLMHETVNTTDLKGYITSWNKVEDELYEQKNILRYQAHHDILTGLPNRVHFTDRLTHTIKMAKRHNRRFALFFIDLDKFKNINDSLGHDVGDKVLKAVAKRLEKHIRKEDILARLSGDEFTLIMDDLHQSRDASLLAEKILKALAEPMYFDEDVLYVTGYSSLLLLKRLPINRLKIDRTFIKYIPEDEEDVAIIKAIIALAESLKLDLIAEGVETFEQKEFLTANHCALLQGYYYYPPLSTDEMKSVLLKEMK